MTHDLAIVIRSVGERTTGVCRALLAAAVPQAPVQIVSEVPFSRALACGFELAVRLDRAWTLVVDADVLVRAQAVHQLVDTARGLDDDVLVLQGLVHDKIFNLLRPAGNHLYRTALLREALAHIPAEGTTLRPESGTIDAMVARGYSFVQCDVPVGLHDYEQDLTDIAKKCFIQAHKHGPFTEAVWPQWQRLQHTDPDFAAAMLGVEAGRDFHDVVYIDSAFVTQQLEARYGAERFVRKPPLADSAYDDAAVTLLLEQAIAAPERALMQNIMFPEHRWNHVYRARTESDPCAA